MGLLKCATLVLLARTVAVAAVNTLPKVDLGYEVHQALTFNDTIQTYNFSNIRFAQPPIGNLRFAAPVPPQGRNPVVQDGSIGKVCPQAIPLWEIPTTTYVTDWVYGNESAAVFDAAEAQLNAELKADQAAVLAALVPADSRETEDCLFLDVVVPKKIFDRSASYRSSGAPVVVYIFGGGYVEGDKTTFDPNGILQASKNGFIWVALNYRLGAFGFLSGPTLQGSDGVSNAALYDQRLALEWVQKNIRKFGGDPNRVTVFGGSAGGGSIMHQITAFGGREPAPFNQAICLYPGFLPLTSTFVQENTTQAFLSLLNVSTIEEARQASSADVIQANLLQIAYAPYGTLVYGPVVDGIFAPALPGLLLNAGAFDKNVKLILSHDENEGELFAPPNVVTDADLSNWFLTRLPTVEPSVLSYIVNDLYPDVYSGAYGYTTPFERISTVVAEIAFTCNTRFLTEAFQNKTYNYEWEVYPALHGGDGDWINYDGPRGQPRTGVATLAVPLQQYYANFILSGNPNGAGLVNWPQEGADATLLAINATGFSTQHDVLAGPRCAYLQKALYS